jgi:hypothetical protein
MFGGNFIAGDPKEGCVLKMMLQEGYYSQELYYEFVSVLFMYLVMQDY